MHFDYLAIATRRRYYLVVLVLALGPAWAIFSSANLLLAFFAWGITKWFPQWEARLNDLAWQVPAGLGLLTLFFRFTVAPFLLHRKVTEQASLQITSTSNERWEMQRRLTEVEIERDSLRALLHDRRSYQAIADALTASHKYGIDELMNKPPGPSRPLADWMSREDEWLRQVVESMTSLGCTKQDLHHVQSLGVVTALARVGDGKDAQANHQMAMLVTRLQRVADISSKYAAKAEQ